MKETLYAAFNLGAGTFIESVSRAEGDAALLNSLYPLDDDELDAIASYDETFLVRFTHNSAAIEGSTLSLADTALVLESEFMPSDDKRLRDLFAAKGIAEGCEYSDASLAAARPLDEDFIRDLHERVALDCQPATRGIYRRSSVYIRGSETVPVSPALVRESMADLMYAYMHSAEHPIVRAAAFHVMFENVHPFQDGNGRVGRILLNRMLAASGYPPIAIKSTLRREYISSLEEWQARGDPAPFIENVCRYISEECAARRHAIEGTRLAVSASRAIEDGGRAGKTALEAERAHLDPNPLRRSSRRGR